MSRLEPNRDRVALLSSKQFDSYPVDWRRGLATDQHNIRERFSLRRGFSRRQKWSVGGRVTEFAEPAQRGIFNSGFV